MGIRGNNLVQVAKVKPMFAGFSRKMYDVGAFGNGSKMKYVANLLVAIHNVATSEAMVLGMKPQQVKVIYARGSGCYGINGADTVSYDAALLSQAVGRPVRVQLE